ncbi:substrate-binding periplasmic protein [Zooshikella sp. RANM57]|uniref:substrate-binding periplasmic protein n=1 Tax=Zooshikella sp. RANM57 TaxID=3425863 RepID=UPI003D6EBDE5
MKSLINLLVLIISVWCSLVSAEEPKLRIVTADEPPFQYLNSGEERGYSMVIMKDALKNSGLDKIRIEFLPWARAYNTALNEKNILFFSVSKTKAREKLFNWCCKVFKMKYYLFKLKENNAVKIASLDDAKNYRTSVWIQDIKHQFLMEKGFTKFYTVRNDIQSLKMLLAKRVDIIPFNMLSVRYYMSQLNQDYSLLATAFELKEMETNTYFVFSNSTNKEVVEQFVKGFNQTINSDIYLNIETLYDKKNI